MSPQPPGEPQNTIIYRAESRLWEVFAQPHIMTRVKRVLPKVNLLEHGSITLADSIENCRDLYWLCDRFPFDLDEADLLLLEARNEEHIAGELKIAGILAGKYIPGKAGNGLPLREYQKLAAHLGAVTKGLLVADQVGLGKSCTLIGVLAETNLLPAVVVAPTHLPLQWRREIDRFLPGLKIHTIKYGHPIVNRKLPHLRPKTGLLPAEFKGERPDIFIINYHKLCAWADTLVGLGVKTVLYDEVQDLRHSNTAKYSGARKLSQAAQCNIGASATPIHNYGGEMFNVMDILKRDCLGSRAEFEREWCSWSGGKTVIRDPIAFGTYLRDAGLMLRRTRADVGRELPDLQNIIIEVEVDEECIRAVSDVATSLARILMDPSEREKGAKMKAGGELSYKLRLATGLAKADFVAEFVRGLIASGEKVLLAGWHHQVYDKWRKSLAALHPAFYTGKENVHCKEDARQRFLKTDGSGTDLLIMSLRAGAGLDGLQEVCSCVVYGEIDWSPAVHIQFTGRVHRDGQPNKCLAYFPLADVGSDPVVADCLGVKKAQLLGIVDPNAPLVEVVDPSHMRKLAEAWLAKVGK